MTRSLTLLCVTAMSLAFLMGVRHWRKAAAPSAASAPEPRTTAPETGHPESIRTAAAGEGSGFLGVLIAGRTVDLSPRVEGRVDQIFVKPGDRVPAGAAIARMDARALRADLKMARRALSHAKGRLKRRLPLSRGAITPEELSDARVQVWDRVTRERQLRDAVADATIKAPFDAVVAARYLDPGGLAGPTRPVVRLLSQGDVRVRFAVPERDVGLVGVRVPVRVEISALKAPVPGHIESVAPEIDAAARMAFAVATLDLPAPMKSRLASGMVTRVHIPTTVSLADPPDQKSDGR